MTFQKTVLIIAVIILILTLSMIGYMLWKAKGSTRYPPEISMCPDFWEVVEKKNDQPGMGIQRGRLLCKPNGCISITPPIFKCVFICFAVRTSSHL